MACVCLGMTTGPVVGAVSGATLGTAVCLTVSYLGKAVLRTANIKSVTNAPLFSSSIKFILVSTVLAAGVGFVIGSLIGLALQLLGHVGRRVLEEINYH